MHCFLSTKHMMAMPAIALLLLTGCGSQITDISAPTSVVPGETFEVTITHTINDDFPFPGIAPETPESSLVFGVALPQAWSISSPASYVSEWDGTAVNLPVNIVPGGPPVTDWVEILLEEESEDPPTEEEIAFFQTVDCKGLFDVVPLPPGYEWVFLRTPAPLPNAVPVAGDTGELQLQVTAGGAGGEQNLIVVHGIYFEDTEETETDLTVCAWIPDLDEEGPGPGGEDAFVIPSNAFTQIFQDGSSESMASVPVPVNNSAMLALLVLLLGGFGLVRAGRHGQL